MNKPFEIIKVEKNVNIHSSGSLHDVSVIKISDNLSKEESFDLDVAILGNNEDEFWCKKWRKFFYALEYNVFYEFFDFDINDAMKIRYDKYIAQNCLYIDLCIFRYVSYYNNDLDDYIHFINKKPAGVIVCRSSSLMDCLLVTVR